MPLKGLNVLKGAIPWQDAVGRFLRKRRAPRAPGWGRMRRLTPISDTFGLDRGQPIDRYYIDAFMERHKTDIHGTVLEIGDPAYTRKFGAARVTRSEVLHVMKGNPKATIVGDLATGQGIPVAAFDCMILTQTLPFIYDFRAAVANARKALKLAGVVLATFPGLSQISLYDMERWGDFWRFTDASARRLFGEVFGRENVEIEAHGNVLVACAFLHGLAAHELKKNEMDYQDPLYQVVITVRAVKG